MSLRSLAIPLTLLLLFAGTLAAQPSDESTRPVLPNEIISSSPAPNSSLDIYLSPMCANDDIVFRVTQHGMPSSHTEVTLRHDEGGIHEEAFTFTTLDGWGSFRQRAVGRYDLAARVLNVTMGQIIFKIPPCISPPSGVSNTPVSVVSLPAVPFKTQSYVNGISREFYDIVLPDRRPATLVILRTPSAPFEPDQWLVESIPFSIASSKNSVGFEQDYPDDIALNGSLTLSWPRGNLQTGSFDRSYVIYRSLGPQIVAQFGAPALSVRAPVSANQTLNQTASTAASAPLSFSPPNWLVPGVLLLLVGAGVYVLVRRMSAPAAVSKKES